MGLADLPVEDSIKLGEGLLAVGAVGEITCGSTGCLSCRGKQSTSLLLLLSSSSGGVIFNIIVGFIFTVFSGGVWRCPVVAQAACLVEGSSQPHYYYHRHRRRRGGHYYYFCYYFQYYRGRPLGTQ